MAVARDNPGVHVSLQELVLLQGQARGFAFLPRQPMHSILAGKHASRLRGRGRARIPPMASEAWWSIGRAARVLHD